jgi:hypothetical protein
MPLLKPDGGPPVGVSIIGPRGSGEQVSNQACVCQQSVCPHRILRRSNATIWLVLQPTVDVPARRGLGRGQGPPMQL